MTRFIILTLVLVLSASCKNEPKKEVVTHEKELTIAQKIAYAYGFENWKHVSQVNFTFNVDRDSTHFERSWIWHPETNEVTMVSKTDSITYNRKHVDSLSLKADQGFINDKYWLLAPFQLVWDKGTTLSEVTKENAPISKTSMNKITLTYPNDGGYTPGDAYDFYFGDDYLIREWVYRKQNQKEPSLITTWENYRDFNGIKLALTHVRSEGNWTLFFTDVKVLAD